MNQLQAAFKCVKTALSKAFYPRTYMPTERRPLEFRVWHKPTERMHMVALLALEHGEVGVRVPDDATEYEKDHACENPLLFNDCIIMQFTGLIDIAGSKIFEGDVLRFDHKYSDEEVQKGNESCSYYYYVVFHKGGFVLPVMGDEADADFTEPLSNYDIGGPGIARVGNMYEHPELLKLIGEFPLHPDHTLYE